MEQNVEINGKDDGAGTRQRQKILADGFDELMPVWLPPSPPSSDGEFDLRMEDDTFDLLYEIDPMNEARLPPIIHELKRPLVEKQKPPPAHDIMSSKEKDFTLIDAVNKCLNMSDHHIGASPAYTENSFSMDDSSQDAKIEPPEPQPAVVIQQKAPKRRRNENRPAQNRNNESSVKRATTPPPAFREEPDYDGAEWNIVEDHALLQAVQLELANHHLVERSHQEGMMLNWELVATAVNKQTRFYRSARQCSIRYQMFVRPKELGQLVASDPITKKTMKVDLSPTELAHLRRGRMTTDSQYNYDYGILTDKKHVSRFKTVRQVAARRQVQFWRGPRESRNLQSLGGAMPARHEAKMAEFEVKTGVIMDAEDMITIPEEQAIQIDASKRKLLQASRNSKPTPRVENRFHSLVLRPYTVPITTQYDPMPARRDMRIVVPALQMAPTPAQPVPQATPPQPVPQQSSPMQQQQQQQQQHIPLPSLQSHSQSVSQQQQQMQQSQQPLPSLQQQQPIPLRQVGSMGGPQMMGGNHNNHDGGQQGQSHQMGQSHSMSMQQGHSHGGHHGGSSHGGTHTVVQSSQMPLQRRAASGSNVQYLQQGSLQQGSQGTSYMVVPSSSSQQSGEGGQPQRVQYVQQAGRGGYGNTLVMQGRGRVVRPGGPMQQRVYIAPDRQYTIPNVVPVRVMPSNQRIMPGQRRNPPAPGTVAAMVLPSRGNGGQIRTIPRGSYSGQQRINVMVSSQNMRQGGLVGQGPAVRRQLVGRPLSQRVDQSTPTVAQVVVAPPSGMTSGGGPPVLHMQRNASMQQGPSSAPVQQQSQGPSMQQGPPPSSVPTPTSAPSSAPSSAPPSASVTSSSNPLPPTSKP